MIRHSRTTVSSAGCWATSSTPTLRTDAFVLGQWVNDSEFAGAVRLPPKSKDPMIGTQDPAESLFVIPKPNGETSDQIAGFTSSRRRKRPPTVFCQVSPAIKFIAGLR